MGTKHRYVCSLFQLLLPLFHYTVGGEHVLRDIAKIVGFYGLQKSVDVIFSFFSNVKHIRSTSSIKKI